MIQDFILFISTYANTNAEIKVLPVKMEEIGQGSSNRIARDHNHF